jgi:aspartyl-tRNA(Asn)/glutamyl-tRNA(Gln) amidotransferase subunit A
MDHFGYTPPNNLSRQPAAPDNPAVTRDGRPVGLQVAGRRFDDVGVLRVLRWYERNRPAASHPNWPITP